MPRHINPHGPRPRWANKVCSVSWSSCLLYNGRMGDISSSACPMLLSERYPEISVTLQRFAIFSLFEALIVIYIHHFYWGYCASPRVISKHLNILTSQMPIVIVFKCNRDQIGKCSHEKSRLSEVNERDSTRKNNENGGIYIIASNSDNKSLK